MKIDFEGRTWSYDDDLITVDQAEAIEAEPGGWAWTLTGENGETQPRSGRSVYDWRQAVGESSARAFRYLYWIMRAQNGEDVPLEQCSFAFPKFVGAFLAGWRAEVEARLAEEEPDPTQPPGTATIPAGPRPAGPPARPRQPRSRGRSPAS